MSAVAVAAIASVGLGAATAAGAFSPGAPAQPNIGAMTADQVNALIQTTPANYTAQAQYNPKFAALNSTIAWQNLFGVPASTTTATASQTGWYDAQGNYLGPSSQYSTTPTWTPGAGGGGSNGTRQNGGGGTWTVTNPPPAGAVQFQQGQTLPMKTTTTAAVPGELQLAATAQPALLAMQTGSRAQDIADVAALGPAAYGAMRGYNPAVTGLYDTMDQQATDLVNQNGALDPFTQAALQQSFRAGEASRGMAGGTQDAAMEAYYQAATQEQRRLTNLATAGTVAGQTAGYYGDPFQQVLARTSGGVQTPGMPYTANQPGSTNLTASLLNPGMTDLQAAGYAGTVGAQNAGYLAQMGGISSLITPDQYGNTPISNAVTGLRNFFAPASVSGAVG